MKLTISPQELLDFGSRTKFHVRSSLYQIQYQYQYQYQYQNQYQYSNTCQSNCCLHFVRTNQRKDVIMPRLLFLAFLAVSGAASGETQVFAISKLSVGIRF